MQIAGINSYGDLAFKSGILGIAAGTMLTKVSISLGTAVAGLGIAAVVAAIALAIFKSYNESHQKTLATESLKKKVLPAPQAKIQSGISEEKIRPLATLFIELHNKIEERSKADEWRQDPIKAYQSNYETTVAAVEKTLDFSADISKLIEALKTYNQLIIGEDASFQNYKFSWTSPEKVEIYGHRYRATKYFLDQIETHLLKSKNLVLEKAKKLEGQNLDKNGLAQSIENKLGEIEKIVGGLAALVDEIKEIGDLLFNIIELQQTLEKEGITPKIINGTA